MALKSQRSSLKSWRNRAKKVIAQECLTYSKRYDQRVNGPSHVFPMNSDVNLLGCDGVGYTDFSCGLGANLIGIKNSHSLPTTLEVEIAERLVKLFPCVDKLKFLKTGSDACQAAVRIARGYTGRKCGIGTGYHGHLNWSIAAEKPGVGCVDELYTKHLSLTSIMESITLTSNLIGKNSYFGYVIVEPVELDLTKKHISQLKELRKLCTKHKIALIFDEVITGFRTPKYCMANYLGIQPDLIVFGKALGNGFPIAVIGGKREFMDTPDYFISSTFAGEVSSLRAAEETLNFLSEDKLNELWNRGASLQRRMNRITEEIGVKMVGIPSRATWVGNDIDVALFWQEMTKKKFLLGKAFFLNFSHTDELLNRLLGAAKECVQIIKKGVKLDGEMFKPVFKRY